MLFFACFLLFSGLNAAVWCLDMIVCVCADGLATPLCGPHTKQPSTSARTPGVPRSVESGDSVVSTPALLATTDNRHNSRTFYLNQINNQNLVLNNNISQRVN